MKTGRLTLFAVLCLALLGMCGCRPEAISVDSVSIRPTSVELTVGSTYQLSAAVSPSDAPQDVEWTSGRPAVATVNVSGLVTAVALGECDITVFAGDKSDVCHVTVVDGDPTHPTDPNDPQNPDNPVQCGETNGEWVNLGLPSGLLWYSVNIGATSPEQYGDYFAWGERFTKTTYDWSNYIWCNGSNTSLIKYCSNPDYGYNAFTDNLTTLQPSDDVATAVLGNGARMPTKEEWRELIGNTTAVWTTYNGVTGRRFTGTNGNSIFLPAAGYRNGSELRRAVTDGCYWSSSLYTDLPGVAWYYGFDGVLQDVLHNYGRRFGLSVRAVRASQN